MPKQGSIFFFVVATGGIVACTKTQVPDNLIAKGTVTPEEGGVIAATDGRITLAVPPGAVSGAVEISIRSASSNQLPSRAVGPVGYDLQPTGMTFNVPITMSLGFSRVEVATAPGPAFDGGIEISDIVLVVPFISTSDGGQEPLADASTRVDFDGGDVRVFGELKHFSWVWAEKAPLAMRVTPTNYSVAVGASKTINIEVKTDAYRTASELNPVLTIYAYEVNVLDPTIISVAKQGDLTGVAINPGESKFTATQVTCLQTGFGVWFLYVAGNWSDEGPYGRIGNVVSFQYGTCVQGEPDAGVGDAGSTTIGPSDAGGDAGTDAGVILSCFKWLPGSVALANDFLADPVNADKNESCLVSPPLYPSWLRPEIKSTHLAQNERGDGVAVWLQRNSMLGLWEAWANTMSNWIWGEPTRVSVVDANPSFPKAVISSDGTAHVTWMQSDGYVTRVFTVSRSNGGASWSQPAATSLDAGSTYSYDMKNDLLDQLFVSHDLQGDPYRTYVAKYGIGGWSYPAFVENGYGPRLAPNNSGGFLVVSQDFGVSYVRLLASLLDAGVWSTPSTIESNDAGFYSTYDLFGNERGFRVVYSAPKPSGLLAVYDAIVGFSGVESKTELGTYSGNLDNVVVQELPDGGLIALYAACSGTCDVWGIERTVSGIASRRIDATGVSSETKLGIAVDSLSGFSIGFYLKIVDAGVGDIKAVERSVAGVWSDAGTVIRKVREFRLNDCPGKKCSRDAGIALVGVVQDADGGQRVSLYQSGW